MQEEKKENMMSLKLGEKKIKKSTDKDENTTSQEEQKDIYLTEAAREAATMFIGIAGSGKSQYIIPAIFAQDLQKKDRGITVICNQKDVAYTLYTMAKEAKRKVILLKPSTNFTILNDLLKKPTWSYNYINDNIINYKKAIKDRSVIIIDMEYDFYRTDAVRATAMLLLQLQTDMCITSETKRTKHMVYINDCQHYLPFIEMLIECGNSYNMSTTLFFQGRNQFVCPEKDYTGFIDNNVRNTILLNNMNYEDVKYYAEKLCPENVGLKTNIHNYLRLPYGSFIYDIQGPDYCRQIGKGRLVAVTNEEMLRIKKKSIKHRKNLTKIKDSEYNAFLLQDEINSLYKYNTGRDEQNNKVQPMQAIEDITPLTKQEESSVVDTHQKEEPAIPKAETNLEQQNVIEPEVKETKVQSQTDPYDQLSVLVSDEDINFDDDFIANEPVFDDFDNVMMQVENADLSKEEENIDIIKDAVEEQTPDYDIEIDEKIEITNHTKVTTGNRVNHILFPTIVSSMQKQYNSKLKNIN